MAERICSMEKSTYRQSTEKSYTKCLWGMIASCCNVGTCMDTGREWSKDEALSNNSTNGLMAHIYTVIGVECERNVRYSS